MTATYQVSAWHEDDWWLARVIGASDDADSAPLNAVTQARSLARIGPMARDLIATILDTDETGFDVKLEYAVPADVGELVGRAKGARAWLETAQELWQERSTAAAKALSQKGYSLREIATLMELSYQRVDQLVVLEPEVHRGNVLVSECRWSEDAASGRVMEGQSRYVDALLVVRSTSATESAAEAQFGEELRTQFEDHFRVLTAELNKHVA